MELFSLEVDVVEYLRRVYYFSKRIAKNVQAVHGIDQEEGAE